MSVGMRPWRLWTLVGIAGLGLRSGVWPETGAAGPADSAKAEPAGEVLAEAEQAVRLGDLERAVELYGSLVAAEDVETAGRARLGLAGCQLRLGRLAEVEETLGVFFPKESLPGGGFRFPSSFLAGAHTLLGEVSLRRMDYRGALIHLFQSLLLHPTPSVLREAGEQVTSWSSPDDVRVQYEMILEERVERHELTEEQREQQVQFWGRCYEGYFLAYQGDVEGAEGVFRELLVQAPEGPLAGAFWMKLGDLAGGQGRGREALQNYAKALALAEQQGDEFPVARLHLGYQYQRSGDLRGAEEQFRRVWEGSPLQRPAVAAGLEMVSLYKSARRYDEALNVLQTLERRFPQNELGALERAAEWRARVFLARGDYAACEQQIGDLWANHPAARPVAAKLLVELALALVRGERLDQVQRVAERFRQEFPEQREQGILLQWVLVQALRRAGRADEAERVRQAVEEEQDQLFTQGSRSGAWRGASNEFLEMGDFLFLQLLEHGAAQGVYEQIIRREPGGSSVAATARLRLGRVYAEEGKTEEAVATYRQLIADYSRDRETCARAQLYIGYAYGKANEYERAYEELRKVREEYPEQTSLVAAAEKEAGLYLYYQGNYHEAIQQLERVLTDYPEERYNAAMALYPLGCSYFLCGKYEKAIEVFKRCMEEHPGAGFPVEAQFYQAVSYYLTEQYGESMAEMDKFIQASPTAPEMIVHALFIKGLCGLGRGEYPAALSLFQKINQVLPGAGASLAEACVRVTRQLMDMDKRYSGSDFGTRYLPLIKQAVIGMLRMSPAFLGDVVYYETCLKKAEEFLSQCERQEGAYQQLIHYLYSQGDYELAVQIGEEYLHSLPQNQAVAVAIGSDVGRSLEALGRYAEAAKVYEKMVTDNPTDADLSGAILYHVVQIYRRLNETAAAQAAAEKLLKEFPESNEAALVRDEAAQGREAPDHSQTMERR